MFDLLLSNDPNMVEEVEEVEHLGASDHNMVIPVLLYGCETWTLTRDLRRTLNSFGTRSLRRIHGYRWSDFVSNERLLRETQMRFVTCIVRERQLRLYGHVAHFPDTDPAYQILSAREPHEWRRPMGRPRASWF